MRTNGRVPVRYHLLIYRREQFVVLAALWALFAIMVVVMHREGSRAFDMADAFLGFVLPMAAGILASSAMLDDAALELTLAAPRAPWRTLMERLGLLLAIVAISAVTYQGFLAAIHVDISALGGLPARQLVWVLPSLSLMGVASLAALAFVNGTSGALFAGAVWIMQLLLKDWFMASSWARYVFLFMRARYPTHPSLAANGICLAALTLALAASASWLLTKEERYL